MSLNWLNTKMVGLFVGCAILFVGFAIYDNLYIYKPLAKRFEWASQAGVSRTGDLWCRSAQLPGPGSGLRPISATFCSAASGEIR